MTDTPQLSEPKRALLSEKVGSAAPLAEPTLMDGVKDLLAPLRVAPGYAGRQILKVAMLALVVTGGGTALFLLRQQQDIRQQAAGDSYACTTCLARTQDEVQCRVECGGGAGNTGSLVSNVSQNIDQPLATFLECMQTNQNSGVAEVTCLDRAGYDDISVTDRSNLAIGEPTNYFSNPQSAFYKDLEAKYQATMSDPQKVQEAVQAEIKRIENIAVQPVTTMDFTPKAIETTTTTTNSTADGAKATARAAGEAAAKASQTVIGPIKDAKGDLTCTCQNSKTNDLEACASSTMCCGNNAYSSAKPIECGIAKVSAAIASAIGISTQKIALSTTKVADSTQNKSSANVNCAAITNAIERTACEQKNSGSTEKKSLMELGVQPAKTTPKTSTDFDASDNRGCTTTETKNCSNAPTKTTTCYKNPNYLDGKALCIDTSALSAVKETAVKTTAPIAMGGGMVVDPTAADTFDQGPTNDCGPTAMAIIAAIAGVKTLPNGQPLTQQNFVNYYVKHGFIVDPVKGSNGNEVAASGELLGFDVTPLFGNTRFAGSINVPQDLLKAAAAVDQAPVQISPNAPNGIGLAQREKIAEMRRQVSQGKSLIMSVASTANTGHYVAVVGLTGCQEGSNFDPYDANCKFVVKDSRYTDHNEAKTIKDGKVAQYTLDSFNFTVKQVYAVGK